MLCRLCKTHEKTQVEGMKTIRTLTELLDLVTELKFASFIVAGDKKK